MTLSTPPVQNNARQRPWPMISAIPVVILDEFLLPQELAELLRFTLQSTHLFAKSEVIRHDGVIEIDGEHRRSRVLFDLGPFHDLFRMPLLTFLPYVLARLGTTRFPVTSVEIQLTATNHQEFFRAHSDNITEGTLGRQLTFVYFFHREPRRFSGGELRIFDTETSPRPSNTPALYRLVYPLQNQVVFFPSAYLHEILPVICPSRQFADSRFTVNGWYHK